MTRVTLEDLVQRAHQVRTDRMVIAFKAILDQWDRKEFRDELVIQVWARLDPQDPEDYEDLKEILGRLGRLDRLDRLVRLGHLVPLDLPVLPDHLQRRSLARQVLPQSQ